MIPHFIILNLDATDRVHYVSDLIKKHSDINFNVINAVVPQTIKSFLKLNEIVIDKGFYLARKLACYLSHYKAYKIVSDLDLPIAIILEDDFKLCENYCEEINTVVNEIPSDCDVVRLYHFNQILPIEGLEYMGKNDAWGDVANLVTRKGTKLLSSYFKTVKYEVGFAGVKPGDILLTDLCRENKLKMFNAIKQIVDTEGDTSTDIMECFRSGHKKLGSTINNYNEMIEII